MTTRAKNCILRQYLVSALWIEKESTILVTDTFCLLTSVISSVPLTIMVIFMLMIFRVLIYAFCERVTNFKQFFFFFFLNIIFRVYTHSLWHFIVPQITIQCMRIACWIPEATNTHAHYVILFCFSSATMVARTRLNDTFIRTLAVLCL